MRKAIRGFIRRDRSQEYRTPVSPEPQSSHIQPVTGTPAVASSPSQEPPTQSTETPAATSDNPAVLPPKNSASVSEALWSRAYRALSEREPELIEDYEKHVEAVDGCGSGALANPESVQTLVKSLQDSREKAQWKFSVRSKDHKVSDQLEKLLKLLALADGVVKQALSSQPYAALAWSTVSVFIPLLSGGFANNMAMVKGFTTIGELQGYWKNYEDVYLRSVSSEHYQNFFEPLSNVYSYMLDYQVRAVCHLSKKQLSRAWQKVAGDNDWSAKEAQIVKISERCVANIAPLQREEMVQSLAAQNERLNQIATTEKSILKTMKDHRQKDAETEFLRALKSAAGDYKGGMEFNDDSVKGTCEWFFDNQVFSTWRDTSDSGVFWLTAGPGCGKSVLARTLIKDGHLRNTTTTIDTGSSTITNSVATVCYFFFKDDDVQRIKTTTALSTLLHQLFCHESTCDLIEHALPAFERSGNGLLESFEDLWNLLVTCAERLTCGDIICVLDALDECSSQDRDQLIRKLDNFYDQGRSSAKTNLKFLITSRAYDDIERSFRPLSKRAEYYRFDADERHEEISHDIGLVIDAQMESFASDFSDVDRQKMAKTLKSKGTKTYLWLHLTLRIMRADPSRYSRRRDVDALLAEIPTQVSEAYEKILNKAKNEGITRTLLQILLAAARPLTVEEANYALTLALEEDGFATHAQLETERWKAGFETIVKNFLGLIISIYDGRLSFIHLTAQEYLVQKTKPGSPDTNWGGRFADASVYHGLLSRCCVRYLLLPELASRTLPILSSQEYPLMRYAASYWPKHFEKQDAISKKRWLQQARRLCRVSDRPLKVWGPVYRKTWEMYQVTFFGWTDLAVAAYLGLFTLVDRMLDDEAIDIDEYSEEHGSALNASIVSKQSMMAELLISKGADVNAASSILRAPLLVAAIGDDEDILSLLLANGASPLREFRIPGRGTTTVLKASFYRGLTNQFRTLLSAIVDISNPDKVLEALTNETLVRCGREAIAMLYTLLPDEKLGDEKLRNQSILQALLSTPYTQKRALQLIIQQKPQDAVLEPPLLSLALRSPDNRQIVRSALQKHDVPCASITQEVLEKFIEYNDAETLRTLVRYCPEGICDARRLLRAASHSLSASVALYEVLMDIGGESLYHDQQLQNELLRATGSPGIIHAFLRLPKYPAQVARPLVERVLCRENYLFPLDLQAEKDLVRRILDHCTEKDSVIDAALLADGVQRRDRETVLWLLELSGGGMVTKAALLEAAARNRVCGKTVVEAFLQGDGAAPLITPQAVLAAADTENDVLGWLLKEYAGKMTATVKSSSNIGQPEVLETLAKRGGSDVDELASAALRLAVEDRGNHPRAIKRLMPYCTKMLVRPSEDFILDLVEGQVSAAEENFLVLVATAGVGIILTERVWAMTASYPRLLEVVRNWSQRNSKSHRR